MRSCCISLVNSVERKTPVKGYMNWNVPFVFSHTGLWCNFIFFFWHAGRRSDTELPRSVWRFAFPRNDLLSLYIGIEVTGRQGRRRRKLLDDLKERRRYSHLKEEALDRTIWRARFRRGFGPVVRQTTKWNEYNLTILILCYVICDITIPRYKNVYKLQMNLVSYPDLRQWSFVFEIDFQPHLPLEYHK